MRHAFLVSLLCAALSGCTITFSGPEKTGETPTAKAAPAADAQAKPATPSAEAAKPSAKPEAAPAGKENGDEAAKKLKEKEEKEKKEKEEAKKKWDSTTEDLTRTEGFFTTWHDEDKLFLELDKAAFGREFVYGAGLGSGAGNSSVYRGAMVSDTEFVLHFEMRGEKSVVLVADNNRYMDAGDAAEKRMLDEVTSNSFIHVFGLAAEDKDAGKVLISLNDWFKTDNLQIARGLPGKWSLNMDLSKNLKLANFPRNLEIDQELIFTGSRGGGNLSHADGRGTRVKVHHSISALPDAGFKPREADQRVGYFLVERKDLFNLRTDEPVTRYIARWRLQKKDPTAEVSDPVKPITYWIENSTPKEWRDAVRKGIEAWEPAFRKAGFSNGIVAKQMPDDADWDPADSRYSVVRWSFDENVGFAIGPSRTDPRTGEIYDADITMQASFVSIYRQRFESYVSDLANTSKEDILAEVNARLAGVVPEGFDPRLECRMAGPERVEMAAAAAAISALTTENFDETAFLNAMLTEVIAHEVGHTLGLRHNFKSSTWRDLAGMADVKSTAERGLVGSVMDYTGINIAAPGAPQGEYFASAVGPYDVWAIEYGYTEFGNNDAGGLKAIASRSNEPGLDYGTDEDMIIGDPWATQWDLGADPVAFAAEQIKLAEAGFAKLAEKGAEPGESYDKYARFYAMFASHYSRYYRGLDRFLWGVGMNRDLVGQSGGRPPIYFADADMQKRALDILVEKGLKWKGSIPDEQRLLLANRKFGSWGSWFDFWSFDPITRMVNTTRFGVLAALTNPLLLEKLGSQARLANGSTVTPQQVVNRVVSTVWASDAPDEHDRWTQTDHLDIVLAGIKLDVTPDVNALFHEQLNRIEARSAAYAGSGDALVALHGKTLKERIERVRNRQVIEGW